jgi:Trk K+ transport system NAD-binding subunit
MLKSEARMKESYETIENHIVILGWSDRVRRIVAELRNEVHRSASDLKPILIVTDHSDSIQLPFERIYINYGRINDPDVLRRAYLDRAAALLIPTVSHDSIISDGESVFSLLSALSVNPSLRVCVEVAQAHNGTILEQIRQKSLTDGDIEIFSFESVSERLLAQASINRGVTRVYDHLLSFSPHSNEIYVTVLSDRWIGTTFRQLATECFNREVILLGYEHGEELVLNPKHRDYVFAPGDKAWYISYDKTAGLKIMNPDAERP